ncbi:MAG: Crp/Fnr family transcriptional regulator [Cyclobacteriaceae bacterium]
MIESQPNSKIRTVKKGEIFQRRGELNSKVYQIKEGLVRSYTIDEKGKDHIFMFAYEGWTIGDAISIDEPCELFMDALEDSVLIVREKNIAQEVNAQSFKALVKRMLVLQRRMIGMMSSTAMERYEDFESTYPELIQRLPQRMIASYLGVTPEALSKLRGERARSK